VNQNGGGGAGPDAMYPGDNVIDWISADGYNYAGCPGKTVPWRSFEQIFGPWYQWAKRHGKPLIIAEFGLSEDPKTPGRKGAWFQQAATQLTAFPLIKALVYFESTPRCNNLVTSSASALAGFRHLVGTRYLQPARPTGS
jgi:beta-mannanase